MLNLKQGCPTFFHNGSNYKFKYIRWAAKREMAQLDAANSMPGNWLELGLELELGLVNNNLKVKL